MTRILTLSAIALMGLAPLAHAQTSDQSKCGPETWSTEKMAYVGTPCSDSAVPQQATPQQATAPLTDAQYCAALIARYDTFVNKSGRRAGMQSSNNAANVAAEKCRAGDTSDMADLERALKDARVELPHR